MTAYPGAYNSYISISQSDNLNTSGKEHDVRSTLYEQALYDHEHTLGLNPQGASATVAARLDAIEAALGGGGSPGSNWKLPVKAVFTSNITQSGTARVADQYGVLGTGVACNTVGDRVLCVGQTDPKLNGIWSVASGSWTRSGDANTAALLLGSIIPVQQGDAHNDSFWFCTNDTITLGSTNLVFRELIGKGASGGGAMATTIAASNAAPFWKFTADLVCDGTDDQVEITTALGGNYSSLLVQQPYAEDPSNHANQGNVILSPGVFSCSAAIVQPTGTKLVGQTAGYWATPTYYGGTVLRNSAASAAHSILAWYGEYGFNPVDRGAYNNANSYALHDTVTYSGTRYRCIQAMGTNAGHTPGETAWWTAYNGDNLMGQKRIVRDLTIQGWNCTKPAFDMKYASTFHVENVQTWSTAASGVEIRRCADGHFTNCRWDWCGTFGASGGNERAAVTFIPNPGMDNYGCNNIHFSGCYWENCGDGDLWMIGTTADRVNKCQIHRCKMECHTSYNYPRVRMEYVDLIHVNYLDMTIGGSKDASHTSAKAAIYVGTAQSNGVTFTHLTGLWAGGVTNQYTCLVELDGCGHIGLNDVYVEQGDVGFTTSIIKFTNSPSYISWRNVQYTWIGGGGSTIFSGAPIKLLRNQGLTTIGAAATSVTVDHGLRGAPDTYPTVTAANDVAVDYGHIWVSNVGVTQFTINVETAPGATLILTWDARCENSTNSSI